MTAIASPVSRPRLGGRRFARIVALGDSVTCGIGVGVAVPADQTWAALLARGLDAASFANLAAPGACLAKVRSTQLPVALAQRPRLATLCVGLNDIIKTSCPPAEIRADMSEIIGALRAAGAIVVVTRLHDPSTVFRVPRGLAAQLAHRVALLNGAIDLAAEHDPGVVVIDLGALASQPACWAVDRIHLSVYGQKVLCLLALSGLGFPGTVYHVAPDAPSTLAHVRWLGRSGVPWLVRRLPAVGPVFAGIAIDAVSSRRA